MNNNISISKPHIKTIDVPKEHLRHGLNKRYRFYRFVLYKYRSAMTYFMRLRYRFVRRLRFRYIRLLVYVGFRLWLKEIHNFENLPQKGPAIIISNHTSYYDWSVLSAVYNRKYIVFLGAKELLERPIVSWLMKLNILIFIDREHPGFSYFREVVRRLNEGHIVVIYPEGKRSETGKMLEPKLGFVKLALVTGTPIIPVGMKGTYEILPTHKKIPRLHKCEMFIGEPMLINKENSMFSDIFDKEKDNKNISDEGLKTIAVQIMDKIRVMTGQEWEEDFSLKQLNHAQKGAAFFDIDNTIVKGQTQFLLAKYLFKKKELSIFSYVKIIFWFLLYKVGLVKKVSNARNRFLKSLKDRNIKTYSHHFNHFFDTEIKPLIYKESLELVDKHRKKGCPIILVSASLEEIVQLIKNYIGADQYIATKLEVKNEKYTGRIEKEAIYGKIKNKAIADFARENNLDLTRSFFYTDAISDLGVLLNVGKPRVVNPDRKLKRIAKENKWGIYTFR